jgi:sec-independent protein translocase protein TatA
LARWLVLYKIIAFCHNNTNDKGQYGVILHKGVNYKGGNTLFGLIGNFGPWELVLILVIVLIIVGPGKLPQVGQSMGKALQNFRKAKEEDFDELEEKKEE